MGTHWMPTSRDILIFHTQSFVIAPAGHNKGSQPFLWLEQTAAIHCVPLGAQHARDAEKLITFYFLFVNVAVRVIIHGQGLLHLCLTVEKRTMPALFHRK